VIPHIFWHYAAGIQREGYFSESFLSAASDDDRETLAWLSGYVQSGVFDSEVSPKGPLFWRASEVRQNLEDVHDEAPRRRAAVCM